ncbi:MAG: restriction endonuclease subunit S [Methanolobus sp.]|uniref:restriction endonuclease subunit S n=1 Tax=Methanolobus sp. TaxID=1874737 RepID=UPI00272F02E3|nr:restriction endonuclease subunit S [Methanolobus sp.]MDP2216989.1 restriction endonuclease subunit S [Methanolobus sp.]
MQQKSELPEGWALIPLSKTVEILDNRRVPVNSTEREKRIGTVPYYGATGQVGWIDDFLFDEELLLLGEDGAPFFDRTKSVAYIIKGKSWVNNHAHVLRAINEVTTNVFLKYYLNSFDFHDFVTGTTRYKLNQGSMKVIPITLPPLHEQHRIVAAIEALFARMDATNEKLDRVPEIMKAFRQAVLAAACDGRLTEKWRKENPSVKNPDDYLREVADFRIKCSKKDELKFKTVSELDVCDLSELPDSWLWAPSNVIFSYVTSGSRGWAKYYSDTGSIFLRIGNLDRNSIYLQLKDIQRVTPPDNAEGKRTRIQKDDILISITADVGSVGYISEELGDAYINQHIALARPVQNLNPKYTAYFLHSQTGGKRQFEKLHRGATKIGLGLDDIRSIAVPLPPLPEQQEIVRRVDALFAFANSVEAKVAAAREKTEILRQSILAKAFSGELVPTEAEIARQEGRGYESAGELMGRIRKEGKVSAK